MRAFRGQLLRNIWTGSAAAVVNIALIAVTYPVYLHFLGYEAYGLWLILSTVLAFSRIGDLGVCSALAKLVAEAQGKGDKQLLQSYLSLGFRVLLVSGTLIAVALYFLLPLLVSAFEWDALGLLPYLSVLCAMGMWTEALPAILSGLGRMDLSNVASVSGRVVGALAAMALMAQGYGMWSLLWGSLTTYLWIQLLCVYWIGPVTLLRAVVAPADLSRFRRLMKLGTGIVGGSLTALALHPLCRILLGHYAGLAAVPVFDIAYRGSMQLRTVIEAGLRALMPAFSYLGEGDVDRLWSLKQKARRLTFLLGTGIYSLAALTVDLILRFWLQEQFVPELTTASLYALAASYFSLLGVPIYYFAMGLGRIRVTLTFHFIQAGVNLMALACIVWWSGTLTATSATLAVLISFVTAYFYLLIEAQRFPQRLGVYS